MHALTRSVSRLARVAGLGVFVLAGCSGRVGGSEAMRSTVHAGDQTVSLTVDGRERRYVLHAPPDLDGTPRPLVLELHGGGGRASNIDRLTGLSALTDARGWLLVMPDGVDRQWHDGRPGVGDEVDDVAFIEAVLDDVAARTAVDPARIFATGISNGAMMSGRLACDLSDRITAVAQVAGTLGTAAAEACAPDEPVSVLVIAGTADPLVPFGGGSVTVPFGGDRGTVVGAEAYVSDWLRRDGLADATLATLDLPPDTTVTSWSGPDGVAVVDFYRIDGGGHTWPGGRQYLPKAVIGPTSETFSASRVVLDFFEAAPSR